MFLGEIFLSPQFPENTRRIPPLLTASFSKTNMAKLCLFNCFTGENRRVVDAMARVPREAFVPPASRHLAYEDIPLPIGEGQTVSQPMIVAMMVSMLNLKPGDKVLEVGTGSGYQAAVLSLLAREVITTERFKSLADSARERLQSLGYNNVTVHQAGDVLGRSEDSAFHAIVVAAAAPRLPRGAARAVERRWPCGYTGGLTELPGSSARYKIARRLFREEPRVVPFRPAGGSRGLDRTRGRGYTLGASYEGSRNRRLEG